MHFSVIYSIDVPSSGPALKTFYPPGFHGRSPHPRREAEIGEWWKTEGDDEYGYGYLEGRWTRGRHRKLCAILNKPQFAEFVRKCGLRAEAVETMGSIGALGCGFGVAPAISFNGDGVEDDAILNAYVTPLPAKPDMEPIRKREPANDRDWDRIRSAVLSVWG